MNPRPMIGANQSARGELDAAFAAPHAQAGPHTPEENK
jgi:hypothetical protein